MPGSDWQLPRDGVDTDTPSHLLCFVQKLKINGNKQQQRKYTVDLCAQAIRVDLQHQTTF